MQFAIAAAREAGEITLRYFRTELRVETKADRSPVTVADRQSETRLRELIGREYPGHGILGEEQGDQQGSGPYRWIIDPLDGTKSFIHGVPLYGVLVGLEEVGEREEDGRVLLGVAHFPALGETVWAARGMGCFWNGRPARVSEVTELGEATVVYTSYRGIVKKGRAEVLERLAEAALLERSWGDCYGYLLVATGRAEVMLDPVTNPWDVAAVQPILEEAGGSFTDWRGRATIYGGDGMATNGRLREAVMEIVNRQ